MISVVWIILSWVAGAYALVGGLLWAFQERIVFQPPLIRSRAPLDGAQKIEFPAADGTMLFAYVLGTPRKDRRLILAFHGNAEIASWGFPWATELSRRFGAPVMLAEYRGYDGTAGAPSYAAVQADAVVTMATAAEHFRCSAADVVLFGHSLGSAIAAELGSSHGCAALVLSAPFSSARDMAVRWPIPGLRFAWSILSRVRYDTVARVRDIDAPVHVVHGDRDLVVPLWMGRRVYENARRKGEMLTVIGAGHNDIVEVASESYWRWLEGAVGRDVGRSALGA